MFERLKKIFKSQEKIVEIEIDKLYGNPFQPRQHFDSKTIQQLSQSIQNHGILQPILVRKTREGYECVAGERRTRAARMAGLKSIPAIVRDLEDAQVAEIALLENIQREDLNLQEEAECVERLTRAFEVHTPASLAQKLGKAETDIKNRLSFLKLPQLLQRAVLEGLITETQGVILSQLSSDEKQLEALKKIHERKKATEEVEAIVEQVENPEESESVTATFLQLLKDLIEAVQDTGLEVEWHQTESDNTKTVTIRLK